jgi:fatty-acyl-CoA synthase
MTETAPGALLLDAGHALAKAGSAGVPHFFADVRVVGPDGGAACPGERGEIIVAGPSVMRGYWGRPGGSGERPAQPPCSGGLRVIGIPDGRWGGVGRAVVVLEPGQRASEADIPGFLDGRLARYKIPKSVQFSGGLPRTATGKILKKRLRETHGGTTA